MTALLVVLALVWAFAMLPLVFAASFGVLVVSRFVLGLAEGPSSALIHTEAYYMASVGEARLPRRSVPSSAAQSYSSCRSS